MFQKVTADTLNAEFLNITGTSGIITGDNIYFRTDGQNRLTVHNYGNVGIGTTTPTAPLHVHSSPEEHALRVQVGANTRFFVTNNGGTSIGVHNTNPPERGLYVFGNTGIGMANASAKLHVRNLSGPTAIMGYTTTNATGDYAIAMGHGSEASGYRSIAIGCSNSKASGPRSIAIGSQTEASGHTSTAMGRNIKVSGTNSFGIGLSSGDWEIINSSTMAVMGGNVGIGTVDPGSYKLAVAGKMIAEEVDIELQSSWPDYVFQPDYELKTLEQLEQYINTHGHLPDVPTAKQVEENGISLGEMNVLLLKKIEELTLYVIQQQKEIESLKEMLITENE